MLVLNQGMSVGRIVTNLLGIVSDAELIIASAIVSAVVSKLSPLIISVQFTELSLVRNAS